MKLNYRYSHPEKLALRRICQNIPDPTLKHVQELTGISQTSAHNIRKSLLSEDGEAIMTQSHLRALYVAESNDATETGWMHVWLASLETENQILTSLSSKLLGHDDV